MSTHHRPLILILVTCTIFYSLLVLGHVSSIPDLRLRFLLMSEPVGSNSTVVGIKVEQSLVENITLKDLHDWSDLDYYTERPIVNDLVTEVAGMPTPTFTDYMHALEQLRNKRSTATLPIGADPSEEDLDGSLGTLVEFLDHSVNEVRGRAVRVKFWREGWSEPHETWLVLKNLPLGSLLLSTVWFLMHMVVLGVSSLAYWSRPFDKSARLFFFLSVCTLNAFLGGFHWWVVASNYYLLIPFLVTGFMLPAVVLHFFLNFPVPQQALVRFPILSRGVIYAIPSTMLIVSLFLIGICYAYSGSLKYVTRINECLEWMHKMVYCYIGISIVYFGVSVIALSRSLSKSRNPVETKQIRMILWAAFCSIPPLLYTVYLAIFHKVEFAFGQAAIPMFIFSAIFLMAYTISVIKFRMLMLDQLIERDVISYFVEYSVALLVSLGIAYVCLFGVLKGNLPPERVFSFTIFLVLVNLIMLWLRDRLQVLIQNHLSRERYQLDQSFQQIQIPPGDTLKPHVIADRMLQSCREGLKVEKAALYLNGETGGEFQIVSSYGKAEFPKSYKPPVEFVNSLRHGTSLQRTNPGSRGSLSPVQKSLRELDGWLVHALELNHQIVGLVVLGQKRLSEPFTSEDVSFLLSLSQVASIAVHCSMYQAQITQLHEELYQKSEKLEDQRRQINLMQQQKPSAEPSDQFAVNIKSIFERTDIIGNSNAISQVLKTVEKVAPSQATILIRGESGTGKELIAKTIHRNGPRRDGPLVCVHCAALSPGLLESELFGHVKGAFTGANQDRIGRFAQAHKGTLFLDEIGDINSETQIKLLRVLQERKFEPVGSTNTIDVDVRLLTATHQNLEKLIREGKFREDLFYRLNVITIQLPPLRERRDDVIQLVGYFMERSALRTGKLIDKIEPVALKALEQYSWPGNIRELENAMERAMVLADGDELLLSHFPFEIQDSFISGRHGEFQTVSHEKTTLTTRSQKIAFKREEIDLPVGRIEELLMATGSYKLTNSNNPDRTLIDSDLDEKELIMKALIECEGNKAKAARRLGMPRSTYYGKVKKYSE